MIYSFEHLRDPAGKYHGSDRYMASTARRARVHARALAARGWTFTVIRWTSPDRRWFRSKRRRALRRDPGARYRAWEMPQGFQVLPAAWWRR